MVKKTYEAPVVEKIHFNYRDQVVAASAGGEDGNVTGGNSTPGWKDVIDGIVTRIVEGMGWNQCGNIVDWWG